MKWPGVAAILWIILVFPLSRSLLEADLIMHHVQVAALATAGYSAGLGLRHRLDTLIGHCNNGGVPGLLLVFFALLIWLLPRSLDASLLDIRWEAAKFVSVPLLIGLPLSFSWPRLSVIGRGFVLANSAAMLATMGALYLAAPSRLCTNYLIEAQRAFGQCALVAGVMLGISCVFYVALARQPRSP